MIPAAESLRIAEPDGRLTGSIGWPARSAFCCTSFRAAPDVMALVSQRRHAYKSISTRRRSPYVRSWRASGLVDGGHVAATLRIAALDHQVKGLTPAAYGVAPRFWLPESNRTQGSFT